jgi:UDP-N-acetyl-2-amino-2-deoxyglucuronate dehydrogenase
MNRVRVGIVGCGKVARLHVAALAALPQAELAAVCDVDPARGAGLAALCGARDFTDVRRMIEAAAVEAVIVCTPHPLHAEPSVVAAEMGVHVLVEKPLAATLADCDRMIEAAARRGVKLGVVSQRRFFEPVVRMKQAIDAGKIGRPILGSVVMLSWRDRQYYQSDPWRGKWATEGGGVLINQAPHHLDILQWLMGPAEEVSGYAENLNHPYIDVEDTAIAAIRFRGGALASVVVSLGQKPGIYTKIHIHGSNGASVGAQTDTGATFIAGVSEAVAPPVTDLWTIPGEEAMLPDLQARDAAAWREIDPGWHYHLLQDRDFLDAILEDREPLITGLEGRKVVEIIAAIYRAQEQRTAIRFPLAPADYPTSSRNARAE